jgi:hypothetical protein
VSTIPFEITSELSSSDNYSIYLKGHFSNVPEDKVNEIELKIKYVASEFFSDRTLLDILNLFENERAQLTESIQTQLGIPDFELTIFTINAIEQIQDDKYEIDPNLTGQKIKEGKSLFGRFKRK